MNQRSYTVGDPDIDRRIAELVDLAGDGPNADLIREIVVTALKLHRDGAERGDVKLINAALKEMRYSFLVFSRFRDHPKVAVFGSARTKPGDPNYELAKEFGRLMAHERRWFVVTGAGPGIMTAANEGAGLEWSLGVNIRLPFEAEPNPFLRPDRVVNYKYFFTRKLAFVKESNGFVMFPGGFGTMDEAYEVLTLLQTGKSDPLPIVMVEAEGTGYWDTWRRFVEEDLLGNGLIAEADLSLYRFATDAKAAAEEICGFYANYHSQRYVDGVLVIRLRRAPTPEQLEVLNREFADIIVDGRIEVIEATKAEIRDGDELDLDRIAFRFDRRGYGRLRQLIDRLNELVEAPTEVRPPYPYREEAIERPW